MTSELDFIAALDAEPGNHWLRQLYADWLEDHGDERAAGMRALTVLEMHPCHLKPTSSQEHDHWMWQLLPWPKEKRPDSYTFNSERLAWTAWFRFFCESCYGAYYGRRQGGRAAAENAAALAWLRLTDTERAKIMADATLTGGRQ